MNMSIVQQEATRSYGHTKRAQGRSYEDEDVLPGFRVEGLVGLSGLRSLYVCLSRGLYASGL